MTKEGIYDFISKQKTSIISSIGEDGYPATRALIQPVLIEENVIWFATYTSSRKVKHYQKNPKACVYFYEKVAIFRGLKLKVQWKSAQTRPQKSVSGNHFSTGFTAKALQTLTIVS